MKNANSDTETQIPRVAHPRNPTIGFAYKCVGYVFFLIGMSEWVLGIPTGLVVTFFSDSFIDNPATIQSLHVAVAAIFSIAGVACVRWGRRLSLVSATDLLQKDKREPVLLLRSFVDDSLIVETIGDTDITMEQTVTHVLSKVGPVVAIGRPGEKVAPMGAMRDYISNENWKAAVEDWLEKASLVVMFMGPLNKRQGLDWELGQIVAFGAIQKLMLVMPPVDLPTCFEYRLQYQNALGVAFPPFDGSELFVTFDSSGVPQIAKVAGGSQMKKKVKIKDYRKHLKSIIPRFID